MLNLYFRSLKLSQLFGIFSILNTKYVDTNKNVLERASSLSIVQYITFELKKKKKTNSKTKLAKKAKKKLVKFLFYLHLNFKCISKYSIFLCVNWTLIIITSKWKKMLKFPSNSFVNVMFVSLYKFYLFLFFVEICRTQ